ncbi:MAG: hypothetical protein K8R58_08720 [Bacteroidales bacterium]|nr:hypothetical protein [Bacteroidales bacterium]
MNRFKIIILSIFIFLYSGDEIFSQLNKEGADMPGEQGKPLRIEIDTKSEAEIYKIIPCKSKGLILFYKSIIAADKHNTKWIFAFYDKYLKRSWLKEIPVLDKMIYKQHDINNEFLYLFFQDKAKKKKSSEGNFQILKFNLNSGDCQILNGLIPEKSDLTHIKIHNHIAYLCLDLDLKKNQTAIYFVNTLTNDIKEIYYDDNGENYFENLHIDTLNNTVITLINSCVSKNEYKFYIKEFDLNGNQLSTIDIRSQDENKKLNSAKLVTINKTDKILIGTYDIIKRKSIDSKTYFNKESTGFYITKVINNLQGDINYYNFIRFKNFTGNIKAKEVLEARKKSEKKSKSRKKSSLDFMLLVHEIMEKDGLLYFTAEAYYPEYHMVTSMYYDYYGRLIPQSYSVFDGYKYFNAFITCFDKNGNMLWDNSLEIYNILTFNLIKRVNIFFDDNDIVLAYSDDGKIVSKIINGTRVVEGLDYSSIETSNINDKLISESNSNMMYWYKNYFICYGYQTIKNNSFIDKNKRIVFYINKIAFN